MSDGNDLREEVRANYEAFRELLPNLLVDHEGEFALLRRQQIIDFFPSVAAAYRHGVSRFEDGLFSIQTVSARPIELGALSHVDIRGDI